LDRLDVRLPIPERLNRALDSLSETLPLIVLVTGLASLRAGELGARLRQLLTELDVPELGDRLNGLADGVVVEQPAVAQSLAKSFQRRPSLPPRARAKDREDRRKVLDALDRESIGAARTEASEKRGVRGNCSRRPNRRMLSGLGTDALRPNLLEVAGGDQAHQSTRDLTVVRIRGAPKLLARVGKVIARNAFPKTKLERIQISFRVVCHVAFLSIDSG